MAPTAPLTAGDGDDGGGARCDTEFADFVRKYTARIIAKASSFVGQRPLLPAVLEPGVIVAVARRSPWCLDDFFGREPAAAPRRHGSGHGPGAQPDRDRVVVSGVCTVLVSETSLVHYTRKPKSTAKAQPRQPRQPPPPEARTGPAAAVAASAALQEGADGAAGVPPAAPPVDDKYWKRRYNYFARFDEGIRMDAGAWFEVTPESVARHIADRMSYDLVVDGTCGVGGNAIQFAITSKHVIAVDTDADRLEDAAHNARIYGVQGRIEFVHDDFANFAANYAGPRIDAVFLSPPWGGPCHLDAEYFSLKDVECPDIVRLFAGAAAISDRVVLYLPRHIDLHEVALLAAEHGFPAVEAEKILFQYPTPHLKLCVVHFGPEAVAGALAPKSGPSRKAVGPTGGAVASRAPRRQAAAMCEAPAGIGPGRASELLCLLPLAGPVVRALYCRCHYLGRFVVALALDLGRPGAATAASPSKRVPSQGAVLIPAGQPRPVLPGQSRPSDAKAGKAGAQRRGAGAGTGGKGHAGGGGPAGHDRIAAALCEALGTGASEDDGLAPCVAWLLSSLGLGEATRLAAEAERERELERARGGVSTAWSSCLFSLLHQRFPATHSGMLDWRKARGLGVEAAA